MLYLQYWLFLFKNIIGLWQVYLFIHFYYLCPSRSVTGCCFIYFFFFNFLLDYRFWGTCAEHAIQLHRYTHGCVLCFSSPLHPHLSYLSRLSLFTSPFHLPSPVPPNRPQCLVLPFLCPCVLIFHHPPMTEDRALYIFFDRLYSEQFCF